MTEKTTSSKLHYTQVQNQLDLFSLQELQKHLKEKYKMGTYNLKLGFFYKPEDNDS